MSKILAQIWSFLTGSSSPHCSECDEEVAKGDPKCPGCGHDMEA